MDIALHKNTRVVVLLVAINEYDKPSADHPHGATQLDPLPRIKTDVDRLVRLFNSHAYQSEGFQTLEEIWGGTAGAIWDRLTSTKEALARRPDLIVLLYWTGHGRSVQNELRLATRDCFDPISASDGLGSGQVVNKLADSQTKALFVLLDVCEAGAASADLAISATKQSLQRSSERFFELSALFSASPFQSAQDGVFIDHLERLLREGPSLPARKEMEMEQWEAFNPNNRLLTLREIEEALYVEINIAKQKTPSLPTPHGMHSGRPHRIFPNPLFRNNAPVLPVDLGHSRWLRAEDVETHFLPKAQGLEPGENGWFFSGRRQVAREIVDWLIKKGPAASQNLFVLTGAAGTGKSALIGRLVALSEQNYRSMARKAGWDQESDQNEGTVPPLDQINAALHLHKLNAEQVAQSLAQLLGPDVLPMPVQLSTFVEAARTAPNQTIVLDALDESEDPTDIANTLIRPLAQKGWRILVTTDPGPNNLLNQLGHNALLHNLDQEPNTEADINEYVTRRLENTQGSPYVNLPTRLSTIPTFIARKAKGSFLYARLTTDQILQRQHPLDPTRLEDQIGANVDDVLIRERRLLDKEFQRKFHRPDSGATALLTPLAWTEGNGLPLRDQIWPQAATAIADASLPFTQEHALWLLREGGRFIVESGDGDQTVYRLFHESLNNHLRRISPNAKAVRMRFAKAFEETQISNWEQKNPYVVRHLPTFLVKSSGKPRLKRILLDLNWISAMLEQGDVETLLARYNYLSEDAPTTLMRSALQLAVCLATPYLYDPLFSIRSRSFERNVPSPFARRLVVRLIPEVSNLLREIAQWRRWPQLSSAAPPLPAESLYKFMGHLHAGETVWALGVTSDRRCVAAVMEPRTSFWRYGPFRWPRAVDLTNGKAVDTIKEITLLEHINAAVLLAIVDNGRELRFLKGKQEVWISHLG